MKKVVIFGNQQIAIDCLNILKKRNDVWIAAVVGCEKVEDYDFGYPSLRQFSIRNNLTYYNLQRLDGNFLKIFKKLKPDLCFSFFYRKIFKPDFLSIPPMGFINIHPSLLPKYRGPVPTLWALLNDEAEVGVTLHYIDSGIDTGDIIAQSRIKSLRLTSGYKLLKKLMKEGTLLFKRELSSILAGTNTRVKQNHHQASSFGQFHEKLRIIEWRQPINKVLRRIQAFTKPYIGARSYIQNQEIIIWKARLTKLSRKRLSEPGKIIKVKGAQFIVSGVDGFLLVIEYTLPKTLDRDIGKYIKPGNKFDLDYV